MGALGQLYGLKIDYYVAVDLNSFRDTITELGGVIVDVQLPLYDDVYPSADGRGNLKLYIPPGMQKMNGQRALAYVLIAPRGRVIRLRSRCPPAARGHLAPRPDQPVVALRPGCHRQARQAGHEERPDEHPQRRSS